MNARLALLTFGLCCFCMLTAGCSDPPNKTPFASCNDHEALLKEYSKIVDRATELVRSKSTNPSAEKDIRALAEKSTALLHRKLTLTALPTLEQAQQYEAISSKFQEALHAICPTCPKGR